MGLNKVVIGLNSNLVLLIVVVVYLPLSYSSTMVLLIHHPSCDTSNDPKLSNDLHPTAAEAHLSSAPVSSPSPRTTRSPPNLLQGLQPRRLALTVALHRLIRRLQDRCRLKSAAPIGPDHLKR